MPEYTNSEVANIARKQKAVIWLTLIFVVSLGYFSVATIQWVFELARIVADNKQIQEWERTGRLNEAATKPSSEDTTAKRRSRDTLAKAVPELWVDWRLAGSFFLVLLSVTLPILPYKSVAAVAIVNLFFVYQLARALKLSFPWLWTAAMIVPFMGLLAFFFSALMGFQHFEVEMIVPLMSSFVLLWLNSKATCVIRNKGVAVGLMGAKRRDLKKLALSD
jgi:hypothetical protein